MPVWEIPRLAFLVSVYGLGMTVICRDEEQKELFGLFTCGFSLFMQRLLFVVVSLG